MKYIIDEVTQDTKYVTGHENGTTFGMRSIPSIGMYNNYHIGNDYNTPSGTNLYAPVKSEVLKIVDYDDHTGYGYAIFLYMIDYDKTLHLAHMREFANIKEGQVLEKGTLVGYSGGAKGEVGAGTSTGSHLHLGIASGRRTNTIKGKIGDGTWLDPSEFDFNDKVVVSPKEYKEDGEIRVTVDVGLRVRQSPSLSAKQIGLLPKGTKKVYTHYVDAEGIRWVKLKEGGYTARRTLDNKTIYADARFLNEKPKPKPKPEFKPYNYSLPSGSKLYDAKGNAYAYPTTQAHTVKILKESNGLGLIREGWLQGVSEAWVKLGEKPKPVFKPYNKTLPANSKLYDGNGNAYAYPTTNTHTVKVLQEKNGYGLIKESWLVGVSEAWIKL